MAEKFFTIQNYPNDVYNAVGQITENAQNFEQVFKNFVKLLELPVEKIDNSSLNKLNDALLKNDAISKKEYKKLKKVIKIRNGISHNFYLDDFKAHYELFYQKLKLLEDKLNEAQYSIFEATDFINNKIDLINAESGKLQGIYIKRPTIFD